MSKPYKSTNPSAYYQRQAPTDPLMQWSKPPTWIERNGEFIAACIGAVVMTFAIVMVVGALIGSVVIQ